MDYKDVLQTLDLRLQAAPGKRFSGEKPVMANCTWHEDSHKSLAVYRDHLYCFGCQKRLSLLEWIAEKEGLDIQHDFKRVVAVATGGVSTSWRDNMPLKPLPRRNDSTQAPMEVAVARRHHASLGAKRQWYLDRGLSHETINGQLLGHNGRAFTIPVWHPAGHLLTVRFRRDDALSTAGPKYWGIEGRNSTLLYNQVALKDTRCVVITEGELDCLRLWQEGIPAVSSTNGAGGMVSLWSRVKRLFRCQRIVIAFDQDAGGRKGANDLKAMICGSNKRTLAWDRAVILRWDIGTGKDITELAANKGTGYVLDLIEEVVCLKIS